MSDPPTPSIPPDPSVRWQQAGPNLVRIAVPGGWLYAPSGALYADFAGTHTFVPFVNEPDLPHALRGCLPQRRDPTAVVATQMTDGSRVIWTRGSQLHLAQLCAAVLQQVGIHADYQAWLRGEPTGDAEG